MKKQKSLVELSTEQISSGKCFGNWSDKQNQSALNENRAAVTVVKDAGAAAGAALVGRAKGLGKRVVKSKTAQIGTGALAGAAALTHIFGPGGNYSGGGVGGRVGGGDSTPGAGSAADSATTAQGAEIAAGQIGRAKSWKDKQTEKRMQARQTATDKLNTLLARQAVSQNIAAASREASRTQG